MGQSYDRCNHCGDPNYLTDGLCPKCQSYGRASGWPKINPYTSKCEYCNGTGHQWGNSLKCPYCNGTGRR